MIKSFLQIAYKAAENTVNDDGIEHAGYMSFMILLSFFPFLVFFLAVAGILGASQIGSDFIKMLLDNLPENSMDAIKPRINELAKTPPQSLLTLAIIGTIWTSSSFLEGLRTILNRVYKISAPPPYLFRRLLSIIQFLCLSAAIFLVMLFLLMIPIALDKVPSVKNIFVLYNSKLDFARYFLTFVFLFTITSLIYYFIPNTKLRFREVLPGTVVTVVLWVFTGYIFSNYISYYTQFSLVYGSLGGIMSTLLFFYLLSTVLIYGAEVNYLIFKVKTQANNKYKNSIH